MRRLLVVTSVLLTAALAVSADELVITRGGRRIIDPDPTTAATNCNGWSYDPAPVAFENDISNVYSTSGILQNHCSDQFPFGDQIWSGHRGSNGVFTVQPAITRTSFRWMFGDQPIDPLTYIGRVASPSVVRTFDGRYFMAFVASVSDPALCNGIHTGQVCGLCLDPFSYYVMYWAMSIDGVTWHVYDSVNGNSNVALANALLYRSPNSNDKIAGTQYRGVTRVRILVADGYVFFLTQFTTSSTVRTLLLRAPYDPSTQWGITGSLQAWRGDQSQWQAVPNGVLPDEFDDPAIAADIFPPVVSIADITQIQGKRFIGLLPSDSHIDYVLSNDLVSWTPPKPIRSAIPYFADGRSYAGSVVDPVIVEDASSTLHLFMASDDGDADHGITTRDGFRDCPASPPYLGLGIYEGIVQLAPIVATTTTVTPSANPAATGVVSFDVRITASDGTSPNGRLTFAVGGTTSNTIIDVNNGRARFFVQLLAAGTYPVHVSFTSLGPWNPSNADTQIVIVAGSPPKHRSVRH
ncbi:MAG TPA: Ig-like domain-containing protein [Vicinamibacterales bacterium]